MEAACEAGPGAAGGGGPDGAGAAGGEGGGGSIADTVAEMLACPCVADLRAGPCGPAFEGAFGCYVEQTEPGGGWARARRRSPGCRSAWYGTPRSFRSSLSTP